MFRRKYRIAELKEGQIIDDIFVVKVKRGMKRYNKGFSFTIILSDETGASIEYSFWGPDDEDKVSRIYGTVDEGSVVRIQGRVSKYGKKKQISANEPILLQVLSVGEYDTSAFIKPPKGDVNRMYDGLKETITFVRDPGIRQLLTEIFTDNDFEEKFKKHPAAAQIHHNWKGGLLQHTVEVVNYCILSHKQFPELDKDLLIAGALLHDVGKMEEMEVTTRIKSTEKGQFIGHLALSMMFVEKRISNIPGFNPLKKNKLLHMIASHHGRLEYGSPKEPMIPEAIALYHADEMSAKIAEMTEFIKDMKDSTDDSFAYSKRNSRNVFLR